MKTRTVISSLALFSFQSFTSVCWALTPFSDNFNAITLDTANWQPGAFGTGAKLKQSGGRLNFTVPRRKADEVDVYLDLRNNLPGYNENWQVIVDVTNTNEHQGDSAPGLWISNMEAPGDAVFLEFHGKGAQGGFAASFVLNGQDVGAASVRTNPGVSKGSIRISFSSTTKTLTFWYDSTGSANGYQWRQLATFKTNGVRDASGKDRGATWNINPLTGKFLVKVFGFAENKVVAAGTESLDNFFLKALK